MNDVEISAKQLDFTSLHQHRMITIKNNRKHLLNAAFRLYNTQWYEITPNTMALAPGESQQIRIKLVNFQGTEDFLYLKGDRLDVRIAITLAQSQQRVPSSPDFQQSEHNLETFGNQRSDNFLEDENRILQQRVTYLTSQNTLLNEALEQFMSQEMDGQSIQALVDNLIEQHREDNEYRSQRVLLMIEEKDRELVDLKQQMMHNAQEMLGQNERLKMQLEECIAREDYYKQHSNDEINRLNNEIRHSQPEKENYVSLYRKYESSMEKQRKLEILNQQLSEEVEIMARRLEDSGNYSNMMNSNIQEPRDQMINRLNARITQLKLREEQLLEENALLEDQMVNKERIIVQPQNDELIRKEVHILETIKRELTAKLREALQHCKELECRLDEQTKESGHINEENWKNLREVEKLKLDIRKYRDQDELFKKERIEYESQIFGLEQTLKSATSMQDVKDQARIKWESELKKLRNNQEAEIQIYEEEAQKLRYQLQELKMDNQKVVQQCKAISLDQQKSLAVQCDYEQQLQDYEVANKKLKAANIKHAQEIERTKTDLLTLKERTEQELQRKNQIEQQLHDRILCLQDQFNNIMKEKQVTQSELQIEINRLCKQHNATVDQLMDDNKKLEQQCLRMQEELGQQKMQFSSREDTLIKEVRVMQDRIQNVMKDQKQKRNEKRSNSIDSKQPLEEERKRSDQYMQKIKSLEEDLNQTRGQKMQLEYEIQHTKTKSLKAIQLQKSQTEQQIAEELIEVREILQDLKVERENIINDLGQKEQELDYLRQQLREYQGLAEQQQSNMSRMELQLTKQNAEFALQNEQKNKEIQQYRIDSDIYTEQIQLLTEQNKQLQQERREVNEKCYYYGFEMDQVKQNHMEIETQRQLQVQELKTKLELIINDHKDNTEIMSQLNSEIVNQKEIYEEIIERQINIIDIAKEKFASDLQELIIKQNQYFNQNEAIKKSLNPQKETQLLQSLQQYAENVIVLAQNQGKAKMSSDKNKQLTTQLAQHKQVIKELQDKQTQLNAENAELLKKVEKFRPKFGNTKKSESKQTQQKQPQITSNEITLLLQEGRLSEAEARAQNYKNQLQLASITTEQLTQVNRAYESEIKKSQNQLQIVQEQLKIKEQTIVELQKQFKLENQRMQNELAQVQNKFVPEDKIQALNEVLKDRDQTIRELKDELSRKKDVADQFRGDREDKQQQYNVLKKQYEEQSSELDKLRQKFKEQDRKDTHFKEFKDKYDQLKLTEKQAQDEVKNLSEKCKQMKQDLTRKDQAIKELKDKIEQQSNMKVNDQENKDLHGQIKKLKEEVGRKDTAIKHFKQKFDDKSAELELTRSDFTAKYAQNIQELEREMRKNEQQKINLKKYENQVNMLLFLLKRIYRDNYMELQKQTNKTRVELGKGGNMNKFSESLHILNLAPEDLGEFLEANQSVSTVKKSSNKDLDRFEQECSNVDMLDVNQVYGMLNALIQDRING